jgi:uncharacterized Zn-finger protein
MNGETTGNGETATSCAEQRHEIRTQDLPISCPMPNTSDWNAHPRVYLELAGSGEALCPYCGTLYVLIDDKV